jgi:hypothetical protein
MAVGNRRVDVEKSLKEAQDATRVGALAPEIEWISAAAAVELIKPNFKNSAFAAQKRICEFANAKSSSINNSVNQFLARVFSPR